MGTAVGSQTAPCARKPPRSVFLLSMPRMHNGRPIDSEHHAHIVGERVSAQVFSFVSVPLSLSLSLSLYPSIHLSIYLSIYPSIHLSIYPSIHLSIYPSIHHMISYAIRKLYQFQRLHVSTSRDIGQGPFRRLAHGLTFPRTPGGSNAISAVSAVER